MPALKPSKKLFQSPATLAQKKNAESLFRGESKSLWNFNQHGVTSSFLGNFLTCREQTRLQYVEGWQSHTTPLAIEFGQCMHWCLEQAYTRLVSGKYPQKAPTQDDAVGWVATYESVWREEHPKPLSLALEQQQLVYGMAEQVLPIYFNRWGGDWTGKYTSSSNTTKPVKWESLEETFKVTYAYKDGLEVPLHGRRDGVFRDKRNKFWVFDTKCLSIINDSDISETLPLNLQQMMYLWVTYVQTGEFPAGIILNVIRRPGQRRKEDEPLVDFLERMRKDVADPKRFDHYFIRYEMAITKSELLEWRHTTFDGIMDDVRAWWEGKAPHYMNPLNLVTKYGRCSMFLPIVRNDFSQCFRRTHAFSELADI